MSTFIFVSGEGVEGEGVALLRMEDGGVGAGTMGRRRCAKGVPVKPAEKLFLGWGCRGGLGRRFWVPRVRLLEG